MPLITSKTPEDWEELEDTVAAILRECGMEAQRQVTLTLPRGAVDVDVEATETRDGIPYRIICECKNWQANVPRQVVHAFRTVMNETGAHRGFIISRAGFQAGAIDAARDTNIDLVTFEEFQEMHFEKWIKNMMWVVEHAAEKFNTYYEPLGPPGYSLLQTDGERAAYDEVWNKYLFAGLMLQPFSPYLRVATPYPIPQLPFDVSEMERMGVHVPEDARSVRGYREFFQLMVSYARSGLQELRVVNPVTRKKAEDAVRGDKA